ncbi:MAG: NUDIX domain-containing protein [Dehalococcoidia bacterium]|nr:NUDIX domain-containing protein [Dehalococcoidia bacterium]
MKKHFTVTGFVVHEDATLFLWHPLLQMWVPPGGHVEENEDPAGAVLREIREETGLQAEIVAEEEPLGLDYPEQLPAPHTVLLERSFEAGPPHQHVDLIYFCSVRGRPPALRRDESALTWVDEGRLERNEPLAAGGGAAARVPDDVRLLALRAIATVRRLLKAREPC